MNMRVVHRSALTIVFFIAAGVAAKNASPQSQVVASKQSGPKTATSESAEGEKRFESQCGRCHNPPEDLSPREARAVVRQMRVRANLSAEDERLILKYLAP